MLEILSPTELLAYKLSKPLLSVVAGVVVLLVVVELLVVDDDSLLVLLVPVVVLEVPVVPVLEVEPVLVPVLVPVPVEPVVLGVAEFAEVSVPAAVVAASFVAPVAASLRRPFVQSVA